jgi:16S rRNA (guanine527-N7)-methyltransferase
MGARTTVRTAPDARFQGPDEQRSAHRDNRLASLPRDVAGLPELPPAFRAALDDGLRALALTLTPEGRRAIDVHVRLLLAWNAAINLTSITDPEAVATRHVLDSLAAVPLLAPIGPPHCRARTPSGRARTPHGRAGTEPQGLAILDLGSGGGFPGLPLAAAIPASRVVLVDATAKKARFLEAAAAASGLADRVAVEARRAEELRGRGSWDVVTARAVGSLADLVELALPLLRIGGRLLAWKRGDLAEESLAGGRAAAVLGGTDPVVHRIDAVPALAGHAIVLVTKARPTPDGYPRDPGRRARAPW